LIPQVIVLPAFVRYLAGGATWKLEVWLSYFQLRAIKFSSAEIYLPLAALIDHEWATPKEGAIKSGEWGSGTDFSLHFIQRITAGF